MNNQYRFALNVSKKRGKYCLFSLPKSNQYQTIKDVLFLPQPTYIQVLEPWNNGIAIYSLKNIKDKIILTFSTRPNSIYKQINSSWTLNDYHEKKIFPNRFINGEVKEIQKQTKKVINEEKNVKAVLKKLYQHTLRYLKYGDPILGLYSYADVLQYQTTDCGGFSTYLLSLFQAVGIPGRLVVGFLIKRSLRSNLLSFLNLQSLNFDSLSIHAWAEIQLPDKTWFPMDPAMEWRRGKGLTKRLGGFGIISNDRLVMSYGEDFKVNIDGKKFIVDILQQPVYL